jgi:hypothetical protein
MYVLFFTDQEVKSVDMCKPKSDGQLGLLDPWIWDRQSSWNISNYSSMPHNIPEQQRTHLLYGKPDTVHVITSFFLWARGWYILTSVNGNQFPFASPLLKPKSYKTQWDSPVYRSM